MIHCLIGLKEEQKASALEEIESKIKSIKEVRLHNRYQVIRLLLLGYEPKIVAQMVGISSASVYNFAEIYREQGLSGFEFTSYKGSTCKLTEDQLAKLSNVIETKRPVDVGFDVEMNWTSPLIKDYIKKTFDVDYSPAAVKFLIKRLGFSFTRPTYVLEKADVEKQEVFQKEFEALKKNKQKTQI
jgi:Transposase and inactivated derivatives